MYGNLEMYIKQAEIAEKQVMLIKQLDNPEDYSRTFSRSVWAMYGAKRYDKAREYMEIALQKSNQDLAAQKNSLEGQILMDYNRYEEAIPFLKKSYNFYSKVDNIWGINTTPWEAMHLANCYYQTGDLDEALRFGLIALENRANFTVRLERKIELVLYNIYNSLNKKSLAFEHLKRHHDLVEKARINDNANLLMEAEVRSALEKNQIEITRLEQEQILKEQQNKTQRLWIFSITGALLSAIILALLLFRNNNNKQKANAILKEQKEEIQSTLEKLESTQFQLIQSEKMASLGELTAGIAHEIQNPLNFVNNFSEVNAELVEELKEEIDQGNLDEVKAIASDIGDNEQKIIHHGKRADAIVKSMLEHSRTNGGEKVPTDINALADEYLRLAYHGFRAKDKSFNAELVTEFSPELGSINVIPQDIGRVVLNIVNNAFQAVSEKKVQLGNKFKPEVKLATQKVKNHIQISVSDNGNGIPSEVVDKIFQPFFTTKPTGRGTGLGLSLSYDIIKAHGGEISVNNNEIEGTEFRIILPLNKEL
jgi:signal transduction histidine kinase